MAFDDTRRSSRRSRSSTRMKTLNGQQSSVRYSSGFLTNVNVTIVSSKFWEPISQPILRQQRREIRQWNGICQTLPNIHFLIIDFYEILRNGEKKSGIPGKIWTNLFPDLLRNEFWGYFWHSKIELELGINIGHGPKYQNTAIASSCKKCTFGEYY